MISGDTGLRFAKPALISEPCKKRLDFFFACCSRFMLFRWWLCFAVLSWEGVPLDTIVSSEFGHGCVALPSHPLCYLYRSQ